MEVDALRGDRHRLEHDAGARRRAAGGAAPQGDGAARLHADRQGLEARRQDRPRRRSPRWPTSSRPRCGSPRRSAPRRSEIVATAAIREAVNRDEVVAEIERAAGVRVEVLSEEAGGPARLHRRDQDPRPSGRGRGRRSSTSAAAPRRSSSAPSPTACARCARSRSGPARSPTTSSPATRPPRPRLAQVRDHIADFFEGVEVEQPEQAVAVGGSATSLSHAGRRGARVRDARARGAGARRRPRSPRSRKRFELDPRRVRILPTGVLLLEKLSQLLGQPLQIGKGGLREGVILDLLNGARNGTGRGPRGLSRTGCSRRVCPGGRLGCAGGQGT